MKLSTIPPGSFPLLPLRNGVVFPGTTVTLPVGRKRSVALIESIEPGAVIGIGVQLDPSVDEPLQVDLHRLGTMAEVTKKVRVRPGQYQLMVRGIERFVIEEMTARDPFTSVEGHVARESNGDNIDAVALAELLLERVQEIELASGDELENLLTSLSPSRDPGRVADVVTGALGLPSDKEVEVLEALDVAERLRIVHRFIAEARALAEIKEKIGHEVQRELTRGQREVILRQQLRAIQRELGEDEEGDLDQLKSRLTDAVLAEDARKVVDRELKRLEGMGSSQAEFHVIRNYLELVADLPWSQRAEVNDDLNAVATKLDDDHYGLEEVKKRILEHLAVRKMTESGRGAILCLVGPPGVGKTSLGQSIADATGRPFARVALGGMRDEAEIRGHRRTYVGAMPGRILQAIRKAGVKNPIVMLDEVDKLAVGWMGSPEAALLEVLDPEQNDSFTDHYLELPFDLSEVLFICTANTLETVSPPLRDRLEVIEIQGYTMEEKLNIARRHVVPDVLEDHGIIGSAVELSDDAIRALVSDYTREAGVRQLKRELTKIVRGVTLEIARQPEAKASTRRIDVADLHTYLGKQKFFNDVAERTALPGVATGMAWTPTGGDILFIETSRMPGKGRIEITGQLGDVMKESARAALSYIRSRTDDLSIEPGFLEAQDLHIHVPAGAVPKDGPSAGVTIFTALASLLSGRRVRPDTAMTGECTLRGRVLPVGGIKAKVLAARRAGISRVILPAKNERDLDEVPEDVREDLEIIFAADMAQVLAAALEDQPESPAVEAETIQPEQLASC